jgi:hypothetical protein
MPPGDPVPAAAMAAFRETRDLALRQIERVESRRSRAVITAAK